MFEELVVSICGAIAFLYKKKTERENTRVRACTGARDIGSRNSINTCF